MEFRQWHGIMTNFLPINKISPFGQCHIQTVLALQVHLISVNGPKWFDISKNLKHVSNRQVTPRSYPWPTTACSGCSCPSGQYEDSENGPKNDFQYPRIWGLKKNQVPSFPGSQVTPRHEDVLDLLQPVQASGNGPKWLPIPKNLGFKKNQISSLHRSWVTSWSSPWPPTAHTGGSCPSGPSEASGNGLKWFPIPKNLGFKKKSDL